MELENRLNLYHVFQTLYNHHPDLLNELLQLESYPLSQRERQGPRTPYLMGLIDRDNVYVITNVLETMTAKLDQPQWVWTIGRAQHNAICVPDDHLSRQHAAIQYIASQGFFLHDLDSTNGTYLNHEPLQGPLRLKDGDLVRIGATVFSFFICDQAIAVPPIQPELADSLMETSPLAYAPPRIDPDNWPALPESGESHAKATDFFLNQLAESLTQVMHSTEPQAPPGTPDHHQRSQILDRFFASQTPDVGDERGRAGEADAPETPTENPD